MNELPLNEALNEALLEANRLQSERIAELLLMIDGLKATVVKQHVTIARLRGRLRWAKHARANWALRQQIWRAERADLTRRLTAAKKEVESLE